MKRWKITAAALTLATTSALTAQPAPSTQPASTQPASTQSASTQPTTSPTTTPASRPTSRPRLTIPPGFTRLDIDGRHVLVEPADETWVREALAQAKSDIPATRPSTMPTDLLAALDARGDELVDKLSTDLAIDKAVVKTWRDDQLRKYLTDFNSLDIQSVCLITTHERLKDIMKAGWQSPALKYERATDSVLVARSILLTGDAESADALVPLVYAATATREEKIKTVISGYHNLGDLIQRSIADRGIFIVQASLLRFAGDQALGAVETRPDQEWLRVGITGVLTAKYTSMLAGVPRRSIVRAMTEELRGQVRSDSINLLAPMDPKSMRPVAVYPYADALRRKSVRAVDDLVLRHGDEVLPKILKSLREHPPTSGQAQVDQIKELTGTDLTPWLLPK